MGMCGENLLKLSGQQSRREILTSHVFGSPAPVNGGAANHATKAERQVHFPDNLDRRRRAIHWARRVRRNPPRANALFM
jgi:hypothetical protein